MTYADAQNPPSPYANKNSQVPAQAGQPAVSQTPGSGGTPSLPPTVQEFADVLKKTLFPKDKQIQNVNIAELTPQIYFPALATVGYGAWTSSATQIFAADLATASDPVTSTPLSATEVHTIIAGNARHESTHVRQFAVNGGPPNSYEQMMKFEVKAHNETAGWLATAQGKNVATNAKWRINMQRESVIYSDALKAEIARVNKLSAHDADKETQLKDFLVGTSTRNKIRRALRAAKLTTETGDAEPMLPPHVQIGDLY